MEFSREEYWSGFWSAPTIPLILVLFPALRDPPPRNIHIPFPNTLVISSKPFPEEEANAGPAPWQFEQGILGPLDTWNRIYKERSQSLNSSPCVMKSTIRGLEHTIGWQTKFCSWSLPFSWERQKINKIIILYQCIRWLSVLWREIKLGRVIRRVCSFVCVLVLKRMMQN